MICLFILVSFSKQGKAANVRSYGDEGLSRSLNEVLGLLPDDYLRSFKGVVTFEPELFKTDEEMAAENFCTLASTLTFSRNQKKKILISKRLIELSEIDHKSYPCSHRTYSQLLKGVLIRELTFLKDRGERISAEADFQRIVGVMKVSKNLKKRIINHNASASLEPKEFRSLQDAFAINMTHLILDPEFECRKPAIAAFLAKKTGVQLLGHCKKNYEVLIQSAHPEDNYRGTSLISPERVYQVHYLFAGKGKALMSRWGHAMFRLVVCAPTRKVPGPECIRDVSHHVVLSYRASMNDIEINYAKGLFGGYSSQMFVFRFLEVVQEYTKHELRDLYSVPLKLNAEEKREFLDLALERFWTYEGEYFFLNNNCGTEAVKHLGTALGDEEAKLLGSLTPLKIFKDIKKHQERLSERALDLSRNDLVKEGVLTESFYDSINDTFQYLKPHFAVFEFKNLDSFLKKSKARDRYDDYRSFFQTTAPENSQEIKQILLKAVFLERYIAGRFMKDFLDRVMVKIHQDKELKTRVSELAREIPSLTLKPWDVVKSSYGVPSIEEMNQFSEFNQMRERSLRGDRRSSG